MKQPRLLGEIMNEYLLRSDDDYARAFRELYREHNGSFLSDQPQEEASDDKS
ncbi:MAG: hypothetical protein Q4B16_07450 [Bacteroidia bacterium]|nr:hypothetical protein [Bacteroidia bacterium]